MADFAVPTLPMRNADETRAFYEARGGGCVEHHQVGAPGGDVTRLNGRPVGLRMAWRDPSRLLA